MVIIFREREQECGIARVFTLVTIIDSHSSISKYKTMREMLVDRCLNVDIKNGAIMINIIIIVFM